MQRRDDWRARFAAEVDRQRRNPFEWGKHDCAIGLVCGVVEAITGEDLARGYRSKYRSAASGLRIIRESGAETLGDFAAQFLPEIHPSEARIGDIGTVAADGPFSEAFSVVDHSHLIVMTEQGHGNRARQCMTRAFRVG